MKQFDFFEDLKGNRYLRMNSERLDESIEFLKENKSEVYGVFLSHVHGFLEPTLQVLGRVPWIKGLMVLDHYEGEKVIEDLGELEYLQLSSCKDTVDFSLLKNLQEFRGGCPPSLETLASCPRLYSLGLWGLKSRDGTLSSLPDFPGLKKLTLVQSSVVSLDGIEKYSKLVEVEIAYCRKLTDIDALRHLTGLRKFHIESCGKIQGLQVLESCRRLSVIDIEKCGEIESLSFIAGLSALKGLFFSGTRIKDLDLSWIERCSSLRSLYFNNHAGYTHRLADFDSLLQGNA